MTTTEAIRLIQKDIDDEDVDWDSPLGEAYKMSFEALKDLKAERNVLIGLGKRMLPGETEE